MKAADIREMSEDQLREQIKTARRELFGLRFQHATGELENTAGSESAKRDLARALTVARQRGIDIDTELRRDAMTDETNTDENVEETPAETPAVEETPAAEAEAPAEAGRG